MVTGVCGGVFQAMSPAHSVHSLSPTQPLGEGHYPGPGGEAHQPNTFPTPPSSQPQHTAPTARSASTNEPNMLRAALTHHDQQPHQQQQQQQQQSQQSQTSQQQQQQQQSQQSQSHSSSPGSSEAGGAAGSGPSPASGSGSGPQVHMQDFVDFDTPIQGGLDCNVEEVGDPPGGRSRGLGQRVPPHLRSCSLPRLSVCSVGDPRRL